jgi:hypothetical protein
MTKQPEARQIRQLHNDYGPIVLQKNMIQLVNHEEKIDN